MCSSRCETDGPATGFMLTDMPRADAATAAPGPAGPGRDSTPGTAGGMPFASSPGGTGGPMKAGFAATGAGAGFAPGTWADAVGAIGGCQLETPRDTVADAATGAAGFAARLGAVVVAGFAAGADDAVTGAFATGALVARVTGT